MSSCTILTQGLCVRFGQGLASKDRTMLRTVLQTEDPEVIRRTVQSLPVDAVLPLIDRLGFMLRFADQ